MVDSKTEPVALSPNQESKRRQVIEAARVVLARNGVSGCTVRAVADVSPLTKSAIHYYFRDIDEIVDLAVAAHLDAMLESLRDVAARHRDPDKRLRAVLDAYLAVFTDKPYAAFLWFEYWVAAGRRNRTDAVDDMLHKVHTLLVECALTTCRSTTPTRPLTSYCPGSWEPSSNNAYGPELLRPWQPRSRAFFKPLEPLDTT